MAAELAEMRAQLAQVEALILAEPDNAEYQALASNIKQLIALQSQVAGVTAPADGDASGADGAKPKTVDGWTVGQECEAVWSDDGKYYKAVITAFTDDGLRAMVTFPEYEDSDEVKLASLRPLGGAGSGPSAKTGPKSKVSTGAAGDAPVTASSEPLKKKKKSYEERKKHEAKRRAKETELEKAYNDKANSWKNFAKKSKKKASGVGGSGKHGQSIFKTPDSYDGKVGVGTCGIGGKGMTSFTNRGKWQFEKE
ncbi:uncharacterized protein MONBRDRAFT_38703 [Monosiga brevicollis MX1]|uniref:Survival of motor neuron-related-splicing factor 30 n=1 Tax=Monosiga brevicollis TaxID=81824 RepID=A9V9M4_MONBE|nr:uncharacterized protein MONBRDRAFT_38703 [Monosiga brevicollis MX1]EDQ85694.1 predicted protein [Monosiga brevicollis MX1]|eukprot:XP_001749409.1 hypothetical protein [Monosiga brevicollis MX1]